MDVWKIVIIIIAVFYVIFLILSIWTCYEKWKQGEEVWKVLLACIFIIPICIISPFTWYLKRDRDYRKKKLLKKQREEREKKEKILHEKNLQLAKKYNLTRFRIRLKGLPFKPSYNEVIFVENEYNDQLNQLIKSNLDYIAWCFDKNRLVRPHFVYLPNLLEDISHDEQAIKYLVPYRKDTNPSVDFSLKNSVLLDYMYMDFHVDRNAITPCFARYIGKDKRGSLFECTSFCVDKDVDAIEFFKFICSSFDHEIPSYTCVYQTKEPEKISDADDKFEEESRQLIGEVMERISELRKMGVSQWALEQLVKPKLELSNMVITKDFRIILLDYHRMEIIMEPLVKAVYLLFLRHPDGILFKCLPDYREELSQIYIKLKPYGMSDKVLQSIEDVTNPLLNSINEKCARIRGAFLGQFDEYLAKYYYVNGKRGEPKKITLPRDLVIWE